MTREELEEPHAAQEVLAAKSFRARSPNATELMFNSAKKTSCMTGAHPEVARLATAGAEAGDGPDDPFAQAAGAHSEVARSEPAAADADD